MKRLIISALAILCLGTSLVFSQGRIALTGGFHQANIIEKNSIPGWDTLYKPGYSSRQSFHIGIQSEIPLSSSNKWFFSPALLYQGKGRSYSRFYDESVSQLTDTVSQEQDFQTNYIEFPLNITRKFSLGKNTRFILSAGPYISFFYNGQQKSATRVYYADKFNTDEHDLEVGNGPNKIKTFDGGLNARAGFEINKVMITGFLSQGLTNFFDPGYSSTMKHRSVGLSLGIWLGSTKNKNPDTDGDGIPDADDKCPESAGSILTQGCPDKDGDGIADNEDKCPDQAGKLSYQGCPVPDTDGDGINDEEDKCPTVAGIIKYQGCPIPDTDGDGINDEEDNCPDMAGVLAYKGCPIPDRDKDGIPDDKDKCPYEAGQKENDGCPVIDKKIIEKVDYVAANILFDLGSSALHASSYDDLNELIIILNTNPALKLNISGHTDNTGDSVLNKKISFQRANAVKEYLEKKGIESDRITAVGFGQEKPVATNASASGRAKNRRVELNLE